MNHEADKKGTKKKDVKQMQKTRERQTEAARQNTKGQDKRRLKIAGTTG